MFHQKTKRHSVSRGRVKGSPQAIGVDSLGPWFVQPIHPTVAVGEPIKLSRVSGIKSIK